MPIVQSQEFCKEGRLVVWQLTEDLPTLFGLLGSEWLDEEYAETQHPQKKREWLAGRVAIRSVVEQAGLVFAGLYKDEHGKPFLNQYATPISMTHSADYVAAVWHPRDSVGIDLERRHEKLIRVAPKFLSLEERHSVGDDLTLLCTYWCAKEALYKLNGRKKVSFREHIRLTPSKEAENLLHGTLLDDGRLMERKIHVQWVGEYCLAIAV